MSDSTNPKELVDEVMLGLRKLVHGEDIDFEKQVESLKSAVEIAEFWKNKYFELDENYSALLATCKESINLSKKLAVQVRMNNDPTKIHV